MGQTLCRVERGVDAGALMPIPHGDGGDHMLAFAGEDILDVDKLATGGQPAVQIHHLFGMALGRVGR